MLVVAVMLRPFQITMVQVLEGYWRSRFVLRSVAVFAVERHIRKAGAHAAWRDRLSRGPTDKTFETVARNSRRERHALQKALDGVDELASYPLDQADFLPTRLGNVLRRGETMAGERYGLNTVLTYPRLYPHLHPKLDALISNQLDLIDTTCAFTVLFTLETVVALPLVWRMDWWSVVPAVFLVFAGLAYRGARGVAGWHVTTLCAAYDLYRFEMLKALHRKLPRTPDSELVENRELSEFLAQGKPWPEKTRRAWSYDHGT
jgi:hypothetical protein